MLLLATSPNIAETGDRFHESGQKEAGRLQEECCTNGVVGGCHTCSGYMTASCVKLDPFGHTYPPASKEG